jgi:hypothetical protein
MAKLASVVEPVGMMTGERRPDIAIPNLRADGKDYLGDFASVDPTRLSSIQSGWFTPGLAATEREREKMDSYNGCFNPSAFHLLPLIMETTGRMNPGFRRFFAEVATFASENLPTGGVGQQRFRARFIKFWKTRVVTTFLKSLAYSAAHMQQSIIARSVNNRVLTRDDDIF